MGWSLKADALCYGAVLQYFSAVWVLKVWHESNLSCTCVCMDPSGAHFHHISQQKRKHMKVIIARRRN